MADDTNIPEPQKWINRIRRVEKINKPKKEECIRFKKAYMGDFLNRKGEETSKYTIRINFIYYFVETIMASVFQGDPQVKGKTKKDPRLEKAADLFAYNTNYWAKEINARAELYDAVWNQFFGPAVCYTSWDYITEIVKDPATGQEVEKTVKDQPSIRMLDYFEEFRSDPDVLRGRRARWVAVRVTDPHEDFIENQAIKEEYRVGPKALKPQQRPEDMADDNPYAADRNHVKSDAEWITYWEVWDRQKMERKYVHESCPDEFLNAGSLDWPFHLEVKDDVFPTTVLDAKNDPFGPVSRSEFAAIEDQIWERVRLRSVQGAIVRRSAPKYLYQKGAGTKEQISKLQKSDILSANELNDIGKFTLMPAPEIPQGFFQWDTQMAEDMGNTSGLAEFQNNQIANTATEASISEGRSTVRKTERTARIEDFVVTVLTKMAQLCQQLQNRAVTIQINPEDLMEGEPEVFNVTKEDIQGEFLLELIPGTMEHVNIETQKRDRLKFLEIAMNSGDANVTQILASIAKDLNLDPKLVMLSAEEKAERAKGSAEPTIKFAPIKMEDMSPADRVRVVEAGKAENNVQSLRPEPRQQAEQQIQQAERTLLPDNASFNKAGNAEPNAPVQAASLTGDR